MHQLIWLVAADKLKCGEAWDLQILNEHRVFLIDGSWIYPQVRVRLCFSTSKSRCFCDGHPEHYGTRDRMASTFVQLIELRLI
jgi:hypothetical protein